MKKKYFTVSAIVLCAGSLMFSSCIGSFALTNKLLSWNRQVGNKFINELVFVAFWVLPVYEVAGFADLVVLNSIEFWNGTNPIAEGRKVIDGNDGRYFIDCDGKGYTITCENDGSTVRLDFDTDAQTWNLCVGDESYELITFVDDTHVLMPGLNGEKELVSLDDSGVWAYKQMASAALMANR